MKALKSKKIKGGALLLISTFLLGSAVLRLGLEAGPALARETDAGEPHPSDAPVQQSMPKPSADDMQQLLNAMQKREEALRLREIQIEDRMMALKVADQAIETKLAAMIKAEQALSETLALADGAAEGDLARLTTVYEKMKPKEAAALFEEMDSGFAAGFLARMRPDAAAGIMAKLNPESAYTISVILAGRNATVPKQ